MNGYLNKRLNNVYNIYDYVNLAVSHSFKAKVKREQNRFKKRLIQNISKDKKNNN